VPRLLQDSESAAGGNKKRAGKEIEGKCCELLAFDAARAKHADKPQIPTDWHYANTLSISVMPLLLHRPRGRRVNLAQRPVKPFATRSRRTGRDAFSQGLSAGRSVGLG
jgi:hypothetical protein